LKRSGSKALTVIAVTACLTTALLLASPLAAQEQEAPGATAEDVEATHEALRALRREVDASFNAAGRSGKLEDFQGVLDNIHDDVVLAAMNGDLVVGKDEIVEYFNTKMTGAAGTIESIQHSFEPAGLTILYGDDSGVAYGSSVGRYELTTGMSFEVDTHWTSTLVKEDGQWLVASFQFGPSIFDNPILDKAINSLYWGIGIGALVGLLLGLLLGRVTKRTSRAA
jgi:ketosteroid isomerase-like protein